MKRPILKTGHSSNENRALFVRLLAILLVCGSLASGTGCHVFRIPSYRVDSGCGDMLTGHPVGNAECPPTVLPPLPGWLAAWHKKKQTPQPPAFPRFQPLPTRPMFSPPPSQAGFGAPPGFGGAADVKYGHWPPAENGGMQPSPVLQPGEFGQVAGQRVTAA